MRVDVMKSLAVMFVVQPLASCVSTSPAAVETRPPLALRIAIDTPDRASAEYIAAEPTGSLHFPQELGRYRADRWVPTDDNFRWVSEGSGERIERADGKRFRSLRFTIPIDYRALPKSYAPFSPFSDGSMLIHSGQFHACLTLPCNGTPPLATRIEAPGQIIGVEGRRTRDRESFVSSDDGTSIFVGHLDPIPADGFIAIIDPELPAGLREHLDRSLPASMRHYASIYGPLSFRPELYVSIDDRPEANGGQSTQGGTLPNQIFMHFDGANAKARLASGEPYWLDWFFAHEAAHLFQQDKIGRLAGDDTSAWLHEGGADAMAALALIERGEAESDYVRKRVAEAEGSCAAGLAATPLDQASAAGNFDLHYQCGMLIWLALDGEIRGAGNDGLDDLNRAFFAKARNGENWDARIFGATARELGASDALLSRIRRMSDGGYSDAKGEVLSLAQGAYRTLARDTRPTDRQNR